jgi:hypothetical protein
MAQQGGGDSGGGSGGGKMGRKKYIFNKKNIFCALKL